MPVRNNAFKKLDWLTTENNWK